MFQPARAHRAFEWAALHTTNKAIVPCLEVNHMPVDKGGEGGQGMSETGARKAYHNRV
jgi:hypothetical protein